MIAYFSSWLEGTGIFSHGKAHEAPPLVSNFPCRLIQHEHDLKFPAISRGFYAYSSFMHGIVDYWNEIIVGSGSRGKRFDADKLILSL